MSPERLAPGPRARRFSGEPSTAIYGTIVVAGVLAAEGETGHALGLILATVAATLVVFWLAHAYAHVLGSAIVAGTLTDLRATLRAEWPIVESGLPPALGMVVAHLLGATGDTAVLVGMIVAVVELAGWAELACRRRGLSPWHSIPYVAVAVALGAAVVALKVAIA